jgi:hypothetical protein
MRTSVLILAIVLSLPALAARKPKAPDQDDIAHGCISVTDIHRNTFNLAIGPNLNGTVRNGCREAVMVDVTAGFFEKDGSQVESRSAFETVAAGASWKFWITPSNKMIIPVGRARIIQLTP